jgi:hypothetical protein
MSRAAIAPGGFTTSFRFLLGGAGGLSVLQPGYVLGMTEEPVDFFREISYNLGLGLVMVNICSKKLDSQTMKKFYYLIPGVIAATVAFGSATTNAQTAAQIEALASGTAVTYDNATITAILSQPNTTPVDGYTYSSGKLAFLANDGTGSLEIFGALPSGSTYVPTVGDQVSLAGAYAPYDGIPEIGTLTSISLISSGNPVSGPTVTTIPTINSALPNLPEPSIGGQLLTLDNVTLSGLTTFPTHANGTATITDGSGNTMTLYQWASSYSAANVFGGETVPTGEVDITGIADVFDGSTEFIPVSITSVPEPSSLALVGLGGIVCASFFRRIKK